MSHSSGADFSWSRTDTVVGFSSQFTDIQLQEHCSYDTTKNQFIFYMHRFTWIYTHVSLYIKLCIYLMYTCIFRTFKNNWLPPRSGYQFHSWKKRMLHRRKTSHCHSCLLWRLCLQFSTAWAWVSRWAAGYCASIQFSLSANALKSLFKEWQILGNFINFTAISLNYLHVWVSCKV